VFVLGQPFQSSLVFRGKTLKLVTETVNYGRNKFYDTGPRCQCHKIFSVVIYCHFKVMQSFCVIKLYYLGMEVNYYGIFVTNVIKHNLTQNGSSIFWYGSKLQHYFNPRKSRAKTTIAIYHKVFIALAPGSTL
jgi:hypothetical protein